MTAKVYFTDMHTDVDDGLPNKLDRLISAADISQMDLEKKFVAIKMHFGEYGNLSFLRANYAKVVADAVIRKGGIPFVTDCSTLYVGKRKNGVEHLDTAELNGFNSRTAGCPIIIGDGIKGTDDVEIPIDCEYIKNAKIGRTIADADVIISLNHFKGHEMTGFGGALKNLGMGCASRRGKMELHASEKPVVDKTLCRNCKKCTKVCAQSAISFAEKIADINHNLCVGCGMCIGVCPFDAISAPLDPITDKMNCKIVEYAWAVIKDKPTFHISIVTDVSPMCDCHSSNDVPIIPNVGMFASYDPVALDRACIESAQSQPIITDSVLFKNCNGRKPDDIFACANPGTHWQSHFTHADKIGMGSGDYEIIEVR